uniref:Uncharacterized protein n=1 Tax=Amphilophus citrinellus TaxID=61819 RepID=A0A3Q0QZG8_AMPCI
LSAVSLQKVPCAAARLAKLPVVSSACASLSVLYTDTKSRHPCLKSACEVLESSVTALGIAACNRASPVIVKLKPQIDYIACKSLDWLEASFPVILSPTDQVTFPVLFLIRDKKKKKKKKKVYKALNGK